MYGIVYKKAVHTFAIDSKTTFVGATIGRPLKTNKSSRTCNARPYRSKIMCPVGTDLPGCPQKRTHFRVQILTGRGGACSSRNKDYCIQKAPPKRRGKIVIWRIDSIFQQWKRNEDLDGYSHSDRAVNDPVYSNTAYVL